MRKPAFSHSSLEHQAQGADFIVKSTQGWRLARRRCAIDRRSLFAGPFAGEAINPIFLSGVLGHLGNAKIAEKRQEVHPKATLVTFNTFWADLALSDDLVFLRERLRRFANGRLAFFN